MSLTFVCAQAISARASSNAIEFRKADRPSIKQSCR